MNKKAKRSAPHDLVLTLTMQHGWQFRLHLDQDRTANTLAFGCEVLRNGRPATKRQQEIWRDSLLSMLCTFIRNWFEGLDETTKNLVGGDSIAKRLNEWLSDYELARYGPPKIREASRFVTEYRRQQSLARASGQAISDTEQLKLLTPVKNALDSLDEEFIKHLAKAVHILKRRTADDTDRRLLEYKLLHPNREHLPEEITDLIRKFKPGISVEQVHKKLHAHKVPHKDKPRGFASPKYSLKKTEAELKAYLRQ